MRLAHVTMMETDGAEVWTGPLREFFRDNGYTASERAEFCAAMRDCFAPDSPPEPLIVNGGAAGAFMFSLVAQP